MTKEPESQEPKESPAPISWVDFLQEHPPGKKSIVAGAMENFRQHGGSICQRLISPQLQLYCPNDTCNGYMFFSCENIDPYAPTLITNEWKFCYLPYHCRNCQNYERIFSIAAKLKTEYVTEVYKFGQIPPFGPPVPPRVLRLI